MTQEPIAYINVEKRTLEFAKKIFWHTPTVANIDRIPLFTKEALAQTQEPVATLFGSLPVYDTTPPQRTWVGLTDEEIDLVCVGLWSGGWRKKAMQDFAKVIEAKLKQVNGYAEEKNT
jgi:hypothetical protein